MTKEHEDKRWWRAVVKTIAVTKKMCSQLHPLRTIFCWGGGEGLLFKKKLDLR